MYVIHSQDLRTNRLILTEHVVYQTAIITGDAFVLLSRMRLNVKLCAQMILVVKVMPSLTKFRIRATLLPLHRVPLNAVVPIIRPILDNLTQVHYVEMIGDGMEDV